jgi:hypothetical protein
MFIDVILYVAYFVESLYLFQDNLGRISDLAAPAGIMGTNYFWMLGEASDDINLKPSDGDVKSRLKDVNGMGRVALYIPASERFNAALDSFRQDKQLQQYYISKTVRHQHMHVYICDGWLVYLHLVSSFRRLIQPSWWKLISQMWLRLTLSCLIMMLPWPFALQLARQIKNSSRRQTCMNR